MTLTSAEEKLVRSAKDGEFADFSSADLPANYPAQGGEWGSERTIRAEIIYALAVGTNPDWTVHAKGIQVCGARIVGALDFQAAKITRPLALVNCYVAELITLIDARAVTIALYGSYIRGLSAFRLIASGSVLLNKGFIAAEEGGAVRGAYRRGSRLRRRNSEEFVWASVICRRFASSRQRIPEGLE
jgi:hypothetical protein